MQRKQTFQDRVKQIINTIKSPFNNNLNSEILAIYTKIASGSLQTLSNDEYAKLRQDTSMFTDNLRSAYINEFLAEDQRRLSESSYQRNVYSLK